MPSAVGGGAGGISTRPPSAQAADRSPSGGREWVRFDEDVAARLRHEHGWSRPSAVDTSRVAEQLGRKPRGMWAVCVRCDCGRPQVVANAPLMPALHKRAPGGRDLFPTLFWLCCRSAIAAVGRLEAAGGVREAHRWLAGRPGAQEALQRVHVRAARLRTDLVPEPTRIWLATQLPGPYAVLTQTGVGGIRGGGVKCLHAHVADHLALGDNPVGAWTLARVGTLCSCSSDASATSRSDSGTVCRC